MSEQPSHQLETRNVAQSDRLQQLLQLGNKSFNRERRTAENAEQMLAGLPISELSEHKNTVDTYLKNDVSAVIDKLSVKDQAREAIAAILAEDKARSVAESLYPPEEDEANDAADNRRRVIDVLTLPPEDFKELLEAQQEAKLIGEAGKLRREEDLAHRMNAQYELKDEEAYIRKALEDKKQPGLTAVPTTHPPEPAPLAQPPRVLQSVESGKHIGEVETGAEPGEKLKLRARTFEEAEKLSKIVRPEDIIDMMDGNLKINDKLTSAPPKVWLDLRTATPEESKFIDNVESVKKFHTQLSELIQKNVHIITADSSKIVDNLPARTEEYKQSLKVRDNIFRKKVDSFYKREPVSEWRGLMPAAYFKGFLVDTEFGDIALANRDDGNKSGVRSNISFQEGPSGGFVHWETDVRAKRKANEAMGTKSEAGAFERRIYLNPRNEVACQIFEEIMQSLNDEGLEAHGKIYDRSVEATSRRHESRDERVTRGDEIVLYAKNENANQILSLVLEKVEKYKNAFAGRTVPRITQRIYDGVALGDEPITEGTSLTENRARLLNDTIKKARADLGLEAGQNISEAQKSRALDFFNRRLAETAGELGINPRNLSFNA